MALEKNDLKQIEKMFEKFEGRIGKQIQVSAEDTKTELRKEIQGAEVKLRKEILASESQVIAVVSSEITDLAEINRAVIQRVDKIDELEKRIIRIEAKVGIAN